MKGRTAIVAAWAAAAGSFLLLYGYVLARMVRDWQTDDNYSHGFLVVPLALYFAWERRRDLARAPRRPSLAGAAVVVLGLAILLAGVLGADLFLPRFSLIVVIAGAVLFLHGWPTLRLLAFPLAFLLLMIPLPGILFNQITFPLQLLASQAGEGVLSAAGVPVLREGNVIVLARTTLEVAEACSGVRSLISLLTVGIIYGYFIDPRPGIRWLIAASTVPIAILANAARVAGTGLAAHYYGEDVAQGFFHTFSGWLVFLVAFTMLFLLARLLLRLAPAPPDSLPAAA